MELKRLIIHQLKRDDKKNMVIDLSKKASAVNEYSTTLINALNEKYKTRETYGRFDPLTELSRFPEHFNEYSSIDTDDAFYTFTRKATMALFTSTKQLGGISGGYYLFADYLSPRGNFLSIFLVRNVNGFLFKKPNGSFEVKSQMHLETEKLAMACKINKEKYLLRDDSNYLSFIRTNRQTTSDYFINWIAASALKKNTEYTDSLVHILKNIDLPDRFGEETGLSKDEMLKRIHGLCMSPDRRVNLLELGKKIYGEDDGMKLINYAEENNIEIDSEFTVDSNRMRRLHTISLSSQDITLKFDFGSLDDKITVSGNRVIIESEELALKVTEEINAR